MTTIRNPVLKGFHPDPSILRVGEDYYIATSTFEWFPGVRIFHSKDLVHWRFMTSPITRMTQLNMRGNANSGGVWAPCLSYDNDLFYLIYTDMKNWHGSFKDSHNYLITAPEITGPWSEPIHLNSSGFDPSMFHDDDGRKWLVNALWDFRQGRHPFGGIVLQEYSKEEKKLVGPVKTIFKGTDIRLTEAPHLYKKHGYYYLITAEGGTEYEHAVTMARSKDLEGPYEVDPTNPILTSAEKPELHLQKAGHGSLVETQTGEWYMAHLCGRPLQGQFCTLGRETALQKMYWTDDLWIRVEGGGNSPALEVQAPALKPVAFEQVPEKDDFNQEELRPEWNTLRIAPDETWLTLKERPGYLRLIGRESLASLHDQSLVARRQQAFHIEVETALEFEPEHFQQMAGLIVYYDSSDFVYLRVTGDEQAGKCLGIMQSKNGAYEELLPQAISVKEGSPLSLRATSDHGLLQFSYREDENARFEHIGPALDVTHLSDDSADTVRFTGTFVGMCVQDLSGRRKHADFDYFIYRERNH